MVVADYWHGIVAESKGLHSRMFTLSQKHAGVSKQAVPPSLPAYLPAGWLTVYQMREAVPFEPSSPETPELQTLSPQALNR